MLGKSENFQELGGAHPLHATSLSIMDSLQLTKTLRENDLNDFKKVNEFVFHKLTRKSTVDYLYFNEEDLQDNDSNSNSEVAVEHSETNLKRMNIVQVKMKQMIIM